MSRHTATVVAWSLVALSALLGFTGVGLELAVAGVDWEFVSTDGLVIVIFLVSGVVGALVASRLPTNPIGWIFVGLVVALGLSGGAHGYVALSIDRDRLGGPVPWAAWYTSNVFLALLVTVFLTLLLFPSGRLLTERWRVVLWAGAAGLTLLSVPVMTEPGPLGDYPRITSPAGVDSPMVAWLTFPGFPLFVAALVGSAASLVLRFRRARGVERQQLKLLASAGIFATFAFLFAALLGGVSRHFAIAVIVGILTIPVAIGVAMLRYRLYEIDRVVSRTLVYGALTVILGAAYVGLVLVGQAVFSSFAGGSNLAIAVSTLVVAALFLPLRSRVQRFVDRRFYRRRYDAQRTLEAFGARLREQVDLETLADELRGAVEETMQPARLSVWLRSGARS